MKIKKPIAKLSSREENLGKRDSKTKAKKSCTKRPKK